MPILGPYTKDYWIKSSGVGPRTFNKPFRDFWYRVKFKNHWSRRGARTTVMRMPLFLRGSADPQQNSRAPWDMDKKFFYSVRRLILGILWAVFCGFKLWKGFFQAPMCVMTHILCSWFPFSMKSELLWIWSLMAFPCFLATFWLLNTLGYPVIHGKCVHSK